MSTLNPMDFLREQAEKKVQQRVQALGEAQQHWQQATQQLTQLETYEREYQQALQQQVTGAGMCIADLINHQSFIHSLNQVVGQQVQQVTHCQHRVSQSRVLWSQEKRRLNAYETLLARATQREAQRLQRQEQKLMDEFAQRAGNKGGETCL